ncbi:YitT family protein [Thetidibacter halocola]|uniref:YitT family protein n=1 Tax=Thetidibacter halocola TaxID=2827239 RepID=A0A8J8B5X8_9RHOB|nr:YitT family protein [Thetidibacter halocola]MBS0122762.1 YitT family protein [Thetidibacter halocola]
MLLLDMPPPDRHRPWEDAQGIVIGATLVALSIQFLRASELFTGQIAGLSLLIAYPSGWSFGAVFFVLNLPFYALAITQLGWRFTLKSFAAVTLMSTMAELLPLVLTVNTLHPALGAALFGVLAGVGLLSLFRHGATLGGVGIVALWLQDTRGIRAGNTQLLFDLCVFAVALALFPWERVAWSLLGAVILNAIITINHRRDRYIARS